MGGADIADNGAMPAFIFHEIVIQQYHDIVGMEEFPLVVDDSQPVRVSVCGDPDITFPVQDEILQGAQGGCGRGRQLSAEQGVVAFMDGIHLAPGGEKDGLNRGFTHAVHGIQGYFESAFTDRLHVDVVNNIIQIFIEGIDFPDQPGFQGFVVFHCFHRFRLDPADIFFYLIGLCGACIPSARGKHLDSVIYGGVMACGDHHAVRHFMLHDIKHDKRRGRRFVYKIGRHSLRCKYLPRPLHRFLCQKTSVVADHDPFVRGVFIFHFPADGFCQKLDICFGKIIPYHCSPSACSKLNHRFSSLFPGTPVPLSPVPDGCCPPAVPVSGKPFPRQAGFP